MTGSAFGLIVQDPDDAAMECLVLGFSDGKLLLGPSKDGATMRVVDAASCVFRRIRFDEPWSAPFITRERESDH